MIATCPGCGAKNSLKPAPRQRCGRCKREFTARDVQFAALGGKPGIPFPQDEPQDEPDWDDDDWDDED